MRVYFSFLFLLCVVQLLLCFFAFLTVLLALIWRHAATAASSRSTAILLRCVHSPSPTSSSHILLYSDADIASGTRVKIETSITKSPWIDTIHNIIKHI